jgi:hypothetical protein
MLCEISVQMKVTCLRGGDSMLSIWEDPKEETYSLLIDYSMEKCDYFTLIVSEQLDLCIEGKEVLDQLQSSLIKSEREEFGLDEKQVTTTYYYKCGKDSALDLKNSANTLFSWVQPRLPEDLCFYTNMDNCLLLTVAHERIGEFNVSDEETQAIMKSINNLSLIGEFNNTTEALIRDSKHWQTIPRRCPLKTLPNEIGNLKKIEFLEINSTSLEEVPREIRLL